MRIRKLLATAGALSLALVATVSLGLPAEAAPSTLFGAPTDGAYLSTYGPVDMYRAFFSGAPGAWATTPSLEVTQPENVSFKYAPSAVIAGTDDTALRTWFTNAPTNRTIWWTFYHEPENEIADGDFTAAQYVAAWQHIWNIAHESGVYKANLQATLILMDYDLDPASGRNWLNYYPGDSYVDVMSWDVYGFKEKDASTTNNETIETHQTRLPSLAVTQARGKPYAISELGYDDATTRPAFLTDLANWARNNNVVFLDYFDEIGTLGDHRLTDTASQTVWKNAINNSLFAGTVTGTNNPATGITSSSATMSCRIDPHNLSYRVTVASWTTTGGLQFFETPGVTVSDGPETVTYTRTGLSHATNYTFRCKVYDASNNLVLKPDTLTFNTLS